MVGKVNLKRFSKVARDGSFNKNRSQLLIAMNAAEEKRCLAMLVLLIGIDTAAY